MAEVSYTRLIDISRVISPEALVYPGDEPPRFTPLATIGPDCPFNLTGLTLTTHLLTHLDPPAHFFPGAPSVDQLPLERFILPALVIEVSGDQILPAHIPEAPQARGRALLFRSRHSLHFDPARYDEQHVHLSMDAARLAAERGVALIGVDYLSVDRFGDTDYPVHRLLLQNNILILEGLDLAQAPAGAYQLLALPLRLAGGDGSPVRAILLA